MELLECQRCGHQWYRRQEAMPVQCPKCKTAYWNRARGEVERAVPRFNAQAPKPTVGPGTKKAAAEEDPELAWGRMPERTVPSMEELRGIAAGRIPVEKCGYRELDRDTGQTRACGLERGHRGRHGNPELVPD